MSYSEENDLINEQKINEILANDLPNFAKKYFDSLIDTKSSSTRLAYAYDIRGFINWLKESAGFRDVNIMIEPASIMDRLTIEDIQEYMSTIRSYTNDGKLRHTSPSTRARKLVSLRSFFRYYYKIREIQTDYSVFIDVPEIKRTPIVTMDLDEVSRYIAAIENTEGMTNSEKLRHEKTVLRDIAIAYVLFGTGIRVSELVGLDTNDVDFYQAKMIVKRKGGDLDEVYFGSEVEEALSSYMKDGRPLLEPQTPALFVSMQHKRLSVRSVELMVKKYSDKAGIVNKKITPHKFRKTYGTTLYEETEDINLVADALHHSSVDTTRRHYVRSSEDHKRKAAKVSEKLFQKSG